MTRLYPLLRSSGRVHFDVVQITPDGVESRVRPIVVSLVPEFGLVELSELALEKDAVLVASYTADAPDPTARRYRPCTVNRTDYATGRAPKLRPPEWNPLHNEYYPVLEYYQHGRKVRLSCSISPLGDLPSWIRVRYRYLPVRPRLRLLLRKTADGRLPLVRRCVASVVTETEVSLATDRER